VLVRVVRGKNSFMRLSMKMQKNFYNKYDVIISDTSSLSNLKNIGKLDLLKILYKTY